MNTQDLSQIPIKKTLVLITSSPHHPKAWEALHFTAQKLQASAAVSVFFYGDGAYTANSLIWQTADVPSVANAWVSLSQEHSLALPVCVSTALARGITDADNAKRHGLDGDNLRSPFYLVGLSELALQIDHDTELVQF
ncbi:MAG: sulfurtransferase complex subunit TusD [Moraxella sp.]|nr:sulfurtransferase complex subunit TusD [Moraxella sp.]